MRSEQITVTHPYAGQRTVTAWPTATPGLVVNESNTDDNERVWAVTHRRSGLLVRAFDSPEAALAAANDLRGAADWTQDAAALWTVDGLQGRVRAVSARYDGRRGYPARGQAADLNGGTP